jgi:DNA-directed RNA polymerase specialized sigma24 family protein
MVVNAAKKRVRPARAVDQVQPVPSENGFGDPIRSVIAALPERQRLVLFLRYYADLEYEAIAGTLDISPGTVGAALNAAHAALRSSLKEAQR